MLEELTVPLFLSLLFLPLGVALFALGWGLRSYRCRYELDNALAEARRDAANSGAGPTLPKREAAAPAPAAPAPAAASSDDGEFTEAQQAAIDRAKEQAAAYISGDEEGDDLTQITGVGPVLSKRLNDFGIYTFKQIVGWKKADVQAFGELLAFKERIGNDDWIGQAKALAKK